MNILKTISLVAMLTVIPENSMFAQTATFSYFNYEGNDARFEKNVDVNRQFLNPILAGFYPDPSICRKGDTYYLVNSSFCFFPGVPIFSSKDLVNWTQIGHVLDRESQLPLGHQKVSGGIYAPSITYNEHNNTFYMITTNVGCGNFFVKTKDPEKGWSEPIYLKQVGGIDPSFFFDKDGKGYIVNNDETSEKPEYQGERAIKIHRFDVEGDSVIGEQKEMVTGGTHIERHPIWIEGPHLFRVGKYYYLMCAEGGTCDWHSEVIFRSTNPMGPFQEYKGNPILTQREGLTDDRMDKVTSTGHADLVRTAKGDWWAVFLGCRPYEKDFYNTGRETYLLPVTWKENWPVILDSGNVVPTVVEKNDLQPAENLNTGNFRYSDKFDGDKLDMRWIFLRNPTPEFYSLGNKGLTIKTLPVNVSQKESVPVVFRRQQHTSFSADTQLNFTPRSSQDLAGMVLFQNEEYHFVLGKTMLDSYPAITLSRTEKTETVIASVFLDKEQASLPVRLKVTGEGRYYDFFYALGNGEWQVLARGVDASNLSTHLAGGFVGTCIGLYATSNRGF